MSVNAVTCEKKNFAGQIRYSNLFNFEENKLLAMLNQGSLLPWLNKSLLLFFCSFFIDVYGPALILLHKKF